MVGLNTSFFSSDLLLLSPVYPFDFLNIDEQHSWSQFFHVRIKCQVVIFLSVQKTLNPVSLRVKSSFEFINFSFNCLKVAEYYLWYVCLNDRKSLIPYLDKATHK